jgi:hypothetical protein
MDYKKKSKLQKSCNRAQNMAKYCLTSRQVCSIYGIDPHVVRCRKAMPDIERESIRNAKVIGSIPVSGNLLQID